MRDVDDDEDNGERPWRRRTDQPSLAKILGVVMVAFSIVGSIFAAGYNWRSVTELEKNQDKYVLREVADQRYENLMARMAELSRQLDDIRAEQIRARQERR